jgi:hypothetical protein
MNGSFPPLRTLRPSDSGGSIARTGFAFQDHVAARFCIEMLVDNGLREVWCETYDDVVLVWDKDGRELIEFVQVKAENLDQLWTPALLCQRDKKKGAPEKTGTSIPERSLSRDCCREDTCFRLVTSLDVRSELQLLKLKTSHRDRSPDTQQFKDLLNKINERIGEHKSPKGDGCESWLRRVFWEVESQQSLEKVNCLALLRALERMGVPVATDSVGVVYFALLALVKQAGEMLDSDREKKCLTADGVRAFVREQAAPYPGLRPSEKLEEKLSQGNLGATERETAQELRRNYLIAMRNRSYLETGSSPAFANAILHQLLRLRTDHDSGAIAPLGGIAFHALCLQRVDAVMTDPAINCDGEPVELGSGCMYDITARCRHRFTRVTG